MILSDKKLLQFTAYLITTGGSIEDLIIKYKKKCKKILTTISAYDIIYISADDITSKDISSAEYGLSGGWICG